MQVAGAGSRACDTMVCASMAPFVVVVVTSLAAVPPIFDQAASSCSGTIS
jgi:hypothetical protein